MRRLIAAAAAFVMAVSLAACGGSQNNRNSDNTEAIRNAADGFLSAIDSGDFAAAGEFASAEVMDQFNTDEFTELQDNYLAEFGLDESQIDDSVKETINRFVSDMKESFVKSYEITDVSEADGKGAVKAAITYGFDIDKAKNLDLTNELEPLVTDYISEHMAELMVLVNDQAALTNKVLTELIPVILEKYQEALFAAEGGTENVALTVEEKDGNWIVTKAEIVE